MYSWRVLFRRWMCSGTWSTAFEYVWRVISNIANNATNNICEVIALDCLVRDSHVIFEASVFVNLPACFITKAELLENDQVIHTYLQTSWTLVDTVCKLHETTAHSGNTAAFLSTIWGRWKEKIMEANVVFSLVRYLTETNHTSRSMTNFTTANSVVCLRFKDKQTRESSCAKSLKNGGGEARHKKRKKRNRWWIEVKVDRLLFSLSGSSTVTVALLVIGAMKRVPV